MGTISLCMIVKNEEDVLARCLDSVQDLVDELVIVDTGSTDATRAIAARYTDKLFDFPWNDDFAAARNFAFAQATCDYCMWLDADDVLEEPHRQAFAQLKETLGPGIDAVMMRYNTGFDDQGNVTFSYYRERIVRNHGGMVWRGAVHEVIETKGQVIYSDCAVSHRKLHPSDPDRNLRIFEKLLAGGAVLDPRQQFYYGRELYYHQQYERALSVFEGFLHQEEGWIENQIEACAFCAQCLYALGREEEALRALLRSFVYDQPRAELCCEIGRHFFDRKRDQQAVYWYQQALACPRVDTRGGFVSPDAYGYLPCIQLCVCYSRMGQRELSVAYNERAAQFKPDAPAVAYNRAYFAATAQEKPEGEP